MEEQSNSKRRRAPSRRARTGADRPVVGLYEELNRITDRIEEIMGLLIVAGDTLGNPEADCAHEVQIVLRLNGSDPLYGQILELRKLAQGIRPTAVIVPSRERERGRAGGSSVLLKWERNARGMAAAVDHSQALRHNLPV